MSRVGEWWLNTLGRRLAAGLLGQPVFVIGGGRSGTTVLLDALGHHPRLWSLGGESPIWRDIGRLLHTCERHAAASYYQESFRIPKEHVYARLRQLGFEASAGPHYGLQSRMATDGFGRALRGGRVRWCAKTLVGEEEADGILLLYPEARFLYILRNGCDVVQSRTRFGEFSRDEFEYHCREWTRLAGEFDYLTRLPQALTLRHEVLVQKPEFFFDSISEFLGIGPSQGPADFARSTIIHPYDGVTRTGVDAAHILAQRPAAHEAWTPQQRETFKRECATEMERLGYTMPF